MYFQLHVSSKHKISVEGNSSILHFPNLKKITKLPVDNGANIRNVLLKCYDIHFRKAK